MAEMLFTVPYKLLSNDHGPMEQAAWGEPLEAIWQGLIWISHVEQVLCCQLSLKKLVLDASSITSANLKP